MVYGSPPFTNANDSDTHYSIMQNEPEQYKEFMASLKVTDDIFEDFILDMFHENPKERLTIRNILKHPWYDGDTSSYEEAIQEINDKLLLQEVKDSGQ